MKSIELKCPNCDAALEVAEDRKECFCQFCGTHILLDDESREVTHKIVYTNEGKIKETERKMREMELTAEKEKMRAEEDKKSSKIRGILWIILFISFVVGGYNLLMLGNARVFMACALIAVALFIYLIITGLARFFRD